MVKTRMGLLDLRVQTAILNKSLRGARVTNIYDAQNGRTYILKLSVPPARTQHLSRDEKPELNKSVTSSIESELTSSCSKQAKSNPDGSGASTSSSLSSGWQKRLLLIESGVRLHETHFDREKDIPSGFCLKLRKHIRARRLDAIRQLGDGGDRIIDLVFSAEGNVVAHLIVEAFAGGNVILTNEDYFILTLLRTYRIDHSSTSSDSGRIAVRERYPVEKARNMVTLDQPTFNLAVEEALQEFPTDDDIATKKTRVAKRKLQGRRIARGALASKLAVEPNMIEHALVTAGFDGGIGLKQVDECKGFQKVFEALCNLEKELIQQTDKGVMKGYVVYSTINTDEKQKEKYEEFTPFLFAQHKKKPYKEYPTFDDAADDFFSKIESDRHDASQTKRQNAAFKKVDKLATELRGQVQALENARDDHWLKAQAIESNVTEVEAAITVVRSAVAAAVSWDALAKMVEEEKTNGNPIAEIIHSLQLDRNEITLLLEDAYGANDEQDEDMYSEEEEDDDDTLADEQDEETTEGESISGEGSRNVSSKQKKKTFQPSSQTRQVLKVLVNISLGAHANARQYYDMRKSAVVKMEKAVEVTDRTIKAASRKAAHEAQRLEKEAVAASIRALRKALWFEKFYWFVSSEDYLVVAGRDSQQNEILVKRYLAPQDIYVHADVEGASSVIVKNRKRRGQSTYSEIPKMTLEQAGTFVLSRSSAWDAKMVSSAWWVRATQVSKHGPGDSVLPTGVFGIRGRKNFLNPTRLVMGIGFLFKLDEESANRYIGGRFDKEFATIEEREKEYEENLIQPHNQVDQTKVNEMKEEEEEIYPNEEQKDDAKTSEVTGAVQESESDQQMTREKTMSEDQSEKTSQPVDETLVDEVAEVQTSDPPRTTKKRMTAKERRNLKQKNKGGGPSESHQKHSNGEDDPNNSRDNAISSNNSSKASASKVNQQLPRGKKHKLKKMRKYMDQDEEERKIALAVLGSKPIKGADTAEGDETTVSQPEGEAGNDEDESVASSDKDKKSEVNRTQKVEAMRMTEEEGLRELELLERETTEILTTIFPAPKAEDEVQYALPVCAPLEALSRYRYRVKLVPGTMKRGKAYRSALVLLVKQAEKDLNQFKKERDAMRVSPESDGIHGMISNVRITAPGLAEAQKALQKEKKGGASKKGTKKK